MKYKGNASSIGTATHTEEYFARKSQGLRRTRNKCLYYEKETKDCKKIRIQCVGPSNEICRYYCDEKCKKTITKDGLVYHNKHGVGIITRIDGIVHEVVYKKTIKLYNEREIKELVENYEKRALESVRKRCQVQERIDIRRNDCDR